VQPEKKSFQPSLSLVLLDAVGAVFVGLGMAKMFAGLDLFPTAFQWDKKGWLFIIIGILLILPLMVQLFVKMREQAEEKLTK
jgi:type IV secretory pathway VirB3-like protein